MTGTAAPENAGEASQLAQDLARRARRTRRIGGCGLAFAAIAAMLAAGAGTITWRHLAGGPSLLPHDLVAVTPAMLALGVGGLVLAAVAVGALGARMMDRSHDLDIRSSLVRLGGPLVQANLRQAMLHPRERSA
jgi:hypothetical protein